jgi:type IV pilus assembly protein PilM
MTEKIGSVWAIDIGNTSLKALRLSNESGTLEVVGFDHIQHGKILSGAGTKEQEKQELIALSVRQFVQQNDVSKDEIIVAVPSANSFARFVNLPPVEPKRIPEIVRFEATQQIPFDIADVTWDWQMMTEEGSAEAKVGIFAIKNEVVTAELEHFGRENLDVSYVQISPMALYNYLVYDRPDLTRSDSQATVVLNIGAENTDLVVCTKSNVWQRAIPMGGNAFTKAIADTFKLSFEKAEKLKRTAPMSKYARQILQAMKPVFTDLAAEIQRSLGFYSSAHPNSKLSKIVALGGGTRMRGLLQYLQQSLQVPIERPDTFKRLGINASVSAAKFHENVADFGVVYGLGVQVLGLGRIESNLLPKSIARSMAWASKTKYFVAAACLLLVVSVLAFARTLIDQSSYRNKAAIRDGIKKVLDDAKKAEDELRVEQTKRTALETVIKKQMDLFKNKDIIPSVHKTILSVMPNEKNNPEQAELYRAFERGDAEAIRKTERAQRMQIFITGMSVNYSIDLSSAEFGSLVVQTTAGVRSSESDEVYLRQMMMQQMGTTPQRTAQPVPSQKQSAEGENSERGFVISIAGYTPYREISQLFDPTGVKDDTSKWGIITRLMNLDTIFDGNSPFEIYHKTEKEHFELKTGAVELNTEMPDGIGIKKKLATGEGEELLVDPITNEVISKIEKTDDTGKKVTDRLGKPIYQTNDQWFVLNMKLRWKDAPSYATATTE